MFGLMGAHTRPALAAPSLVSNASVEFSQKSKITSPCRKPCPSKPWAT